MADIMETKKATDTVILAAVTRALEKDNEQVYSIIFGQLIIPLSQSRIPSAATPAIMDYLMEIETAPKNTMYTTQIQEINKALAKAGWDSTPGENFPYRGWQTEPNIPALVAELEVIMAPKGPGIAEVARNIADAVAKPKPLPVYLEKAIQRAAETTAKANRQSDSLLDDVAFDEAKESVDDEEEDLKLAKHLSLSYNTGTSAASATSPPSKCRWSCSTDDSSMDIEAQEPPSSLSESAKASFAVLDHLLNKSLPPLRSTPSVTNLPSQKSGDPFAGPQPILTLVCPHINAHDMKSPIEQLLCMSGSTNGSLNAIIVKDFYACSPNVFEKIWVRLQVGDMRFSPTKVIEFMKMYLDVFNDKKSSW